MPPKAKIRDINELSTLLAESRNGRAVVHCHGVFDLMHIGHIRHFEDAKKKGDILVVTITPDRYVNKGPHRPVFPESLRAETIASLACVDYVAINKWPTAVEAIELVKPDAYAKGSDYKDASADHTGGITLERKAVEAAGGQLIFTDEITFSSSTLLNRHLPVYSEDVSEYLVAFRQKYTAETVTGFLKQAAQLKALVLGEAIIDEYQYCETLGKSGKEPILAAQFVRRETYVGGSLAVANHVASCAGSVRLVAELGTIQSYESLMANLAESVTPQFIAMENAPTLVKRRFVETYPFQKLFEVYVMDEQAAQRKSSELCAVLERLVPQFDVVIVADYGHGMLSTEAIDIICSKARRLAVNAQLNAGNHGFNTISKYPRANFVSLSEKEIRLETRQPTGPLEPIVRRVSKELGGARMLVTRGAKGNLCYSENGEFCSAPALTMKTVDRIGAGDAVFSVASLCAALDAPMDLIGFIGNAVGTEAVGIVGNAKFIERAPLLKHVESLLK